MAGSRLPGTFRIASWDCTAPDISSAPFRSAFRRDPETNWFGSGESFGQRKTAVNLKSFFGELKRRNVYKVAVAYAVVAWLLVQIATQVFPFFEIPNWAVRLVVLAIIVGFPIALVIAWAFELTPTGLKRTEDVDPFDSRSGQVLAATAQRPHHRAWIFV